MKKFFILLLVLSFLLMCGCASDGVDGDKVVIQKLSIDCACNEINAGDSFEVVLYVNSEKTDFDNVRNIQLVIIKGWEDSEFKNGRIYIDNSAENESEIEFYVKSGDVTSNTLKVKILNEEQVKQQQILEYENKIAEIKDQIKQYNNEKTQLQTQANNASNDFYNYERYCETYGYMVNGNWKVSSSSSVRIQYDKLYATMNEYYIKLSNKESQIAKAQTEITALQNKIKELQ